MEHYIIGRKIGEGKFEKDYWEHGFIYKNSIAFHEKSEDICYIPEKSDDSGYNYNDFLAIANNNHDMAVILFELASWQTPEMLFDMLLSSSDKLKEIC